MDWVLQVFLTLCEDDLRRLGFRSGHARKLMLSLSTLLPLAENVRPLPLHPHSQ